MLDLVVNRDCLISHAKAHTLVSPTVADVIAESSLMDIRSLWTLKACLHGHENKNRKFLFNIKTVRMIRIENLMLRKVLKQTD